MPVDINRSSSSTVTFSSPQEVVISHLDDSIRLGDGTTLVDVTVNNELQVRDDDANTTLDLINAKLVDQTDAGVGQTPTSVSVTTGSTLVLAANSSRKWAVITNLGNRTVYLAVGVMAVDGAGIPISTNGFLLIGPDNFSTEAINGIVSASSQTVQVQEIEEAP